MSAPLSKILFTFLRYALLILGVYFGVAIIVAIDVNASLAAIDPADARTWPEMGPQVRYFFIPVLGSILAIAAVCINIIVGLFHRRDFRWPVWFMLGVAYSFALSVLPLGQAIHVPMVANTISALVTVLAVVVIRVAFGRQRENVG